MFWTEAAGPDSWDNHIVIAAPLTGSRYWPRDSVRHHINIQFDTIESGLVLVVSMDAVLAIWSLIMTRLSG